MYANKQLSCLSLAYGKTRTVGVLFICGTCGIMAVNVNIPMVAIYLYIVLLMCGLSVPVVNAATVDLYPTNSRYVCNERSRFRQKSIAGRLLTVQFNWLAERWPFVYR